MAVAIKVRHVNHSPATATVVSAQDCAESSHVVAKWPRSLVRRECGELEGDWNLVWHCRYLQSSLPQPRCR